MSGAAARGTKILLTTRCRIVAEEIGVNSIFHLNGLSYQDSFSLLKMLALPGIDDKDPILEMLEPMSTRVAITPKDFR